MVGARIIFPEFRDEQSDSRYPFADTATLISDTGFELPRDGFIDAVVYAIGGGVSAHIATIDVTETSLTITIGTASSAALCSTTYEILSPPESGKLVLTDSYGRPAGLLLLTVPAMRSIGGWPVGPHAFESAATELVAGVAIPAQEPGVRGILTPTGELLTGDVWLIGDRGITLRQTEPNTIRVDIVGAPLFKRFECLDEDGQNIGVFQPKNFIKTINGVAPDKFGNFNFTIVTKPVNGSIMTDSILRIYPENDVLKIEAVGSKVL
jgi:hypothetical protein